MDLDAAVTWALRSDDEPVESPDPEVKSPGAQPKSVFGEFSGLARMLGDSCVDLGQGFPNYDPPDFVVQALRDELDGTGKGKVRTRHQYTRTAGHVPLVEVLAERYSGHLGRPLDALKEVAVTVGATNALFLAMQAALSRSPEAREIVALEPFFELYRSQAHGLGADFRSVPLRFDEAKHSFELDIEALASSLGPQTAALIVNTPHNPTGKAFDESEMEAIAELLRQHPNILVISDEVYKYMIFDPPSSGVAEAKDMPAGHIHFARLPDMWERTLTVSSAGKTFGITGWQIGWLIGPSAWMEPIQRFMPNLQFCAPTLTQRALCRVLRQAAEPYSGVGSYYEWLRQDYARRRASMVEALESAGITTARSQGGFFLLGDISDLCGPEGPLHESWEASLRPDEAKDWTCCRSLAAEVGIVCLPVSPFFGEQTPESIRTRFARFCFAKTDATLEEAAKRLRSLRA
ncbi:ccbl [Symbiodinium microadriaticum]|nr:ccbl [Symbiodinium microadriaticum]